ncbi:uncharacterized protein LOC131163519 [Malania oleifera]|uniref:uncharacterized protein LOC131163519 n=1 Tax=Malania oleifera TaxID=397392 RepID=UPI0025ADC5FA|nr:uncharacterized protein LOC131163519 [Malania oleifera]
MLGPKLVQQTSTKVVLIREKIKATQSWQKSYADTRRRVLEFEIGDMIFLRISLMKGVMEFGKKGKMSSRYIGPIEILERIGPVAYRVALPPILSRVHNVLHILVLRKYVLDPSHVIIYEPLEIGDVLTYKEVLVQILGEKDYVFDCEGQNDVYGRKGQEYV